MSIVGIRKEAVEIEGCIASFEQEMLDIIDNVEEYSKRRGEQGGILTGFPLFDWATDGLQPGLTLFGGQANSGKTGVMMQMAWACSRIESNNAYALYFSLDDPSFDTIPRVIACDQQLPINSVRFPGRNDNKKEKWKRQLGVKRLRDNIKHFKVYDQNQGSSIDFIVETVKQHVINLEAAGDGRRLVIFIDGFHEIDTEGDLDANSKQEFLAKALDKLSNKYMCPVVCSCELKKYDNPHKKPSLADFKGAVKLIYKSKLCCVVYNEVGIKKDAAKCFHVREGVQGKQPVLELDFCKNKFTSFKGNLYYKFFPEMSYLEEIPRDEVGDYKI